MQELPEEMCCICGWTTGKAGKGEDSIYLTLLIDYEAMKTGDEIGPLCSGCFHELADAGIVDEDE